jgi:hypothetical protein
MLLMTALCASLCTQQQFNQVLPHGQYTWAIICLRKGTRDDGALLELGGCSRHSHILAPEREWGPLVGRARGMRAASTAAP